VNLAQLSPSLLNVFAILVQWYIGKQTPFLHTPTHLALTPGPSGLCSGSKGKATDHQGTIGWQLSSISFEVLDGGDLESMKTGVDLFCCVSCPHNLVCFPKERWTQYTRPYIAGL
jgi:hypothetical protein